MPFTQVRVGLGGRTGAKLTPMSAQTQSAPRITAPQIAARKGAVPIVCLTAYTAPMAALLDDHCDLLLVGDSVGMVVHGLPDTVGVTLDMMILHGQAVMRGSKKALVVVDMPFGSYEGGPEFAYANAVRVLKETGCQAIKVESGPAVAATIEYLVARGIPVIGHVGLRPQAINVDGGFKAKGRNNIERDRVLAEAKAADAAGAFAIVVEGGGARRGPKRSRGASQPPRSGLALRPPVTARSWSLTTFWACSTGPQNSSAATPTCAPRC